MTARLLCLCVILFCVTTDIFSQQKGFYSLAVLQELKVRAECQNARQFFTEWFNTGKMAETEKDFLGAHAIYARAQRYFEEYQMCHLDTVDIQVEQLEINPPFTYQSMLLEVRELAEEKNYLSAVYKYKEAGQYFLENNISAFGLIHSSLNDFALENCPEPFLHYLALYYLENGEAETSLRFFTSLIDRDYNSIHSLNGGLKKLGFYLGRQDRMKGASGKPKLLAHSYFFNEQMQNAGPREAESLRLAFRPFVSGYMRGWKKRIK